MRIRLLFGKRGIGPDGILEFIQACRGLPEFRGRGDVRGFSAVVDPVAGPGRVRFTGSGRFDRQEPDLEDRLVRDNLKILQLVVFAVVQFEGPEFRPVHIRAVFGKGIENRNDPIERRCMERGRIQLADSPGRNAIPGIVIEAVRPGEKDVGTVDRDAVKPRGTVGELHDRGVSFFLPGKDGDGRRDGTLHPGRILSRDLQLDAVNLRGLAVLLLFHDAAVPLDNAEPRRVLDLRVVVHDDDEAGFLHRHRRGERDGVVPEVDPAEIVQERPLGDQVVSASVVDLHLLVEIFCARFDPQADDLCVVQIGKSLCGQARRDPHGSVRERFEPGDRRV